MRYRLAAIFAITAFGVVDSPAFAQSDLWLSRGTTVCVLEPSIATGRLAAQKCESYAYLPPGTVARRLSGRPGDTSTVIETRYGLTARTTPNARLWNDQDYVAFRRTGTVAFVARDAVVEGINSVDGKVPCLLTREEWYRADPDPSDASKVILTLTERKKECVPAGSTRTASFPRRNLTVVTFSSSVADELDQLGQPVRLPSTYRTFPIKNMLSIPKACGETVDDSSQAQANLGLDLASILGGLISRLTGAVKANFTIDRVKKFTRTSPAGLQEDIRYYGGPDLVHIAQKKECTFNAASGYHVPPSYWHYVVAGSQNVDLDSQWISEKRIPVNSTTKAPRITCAKDYFLLADALIESGYPPETVPFIISRISEIPPTFGPDSACSSKG